MGRWGDERVLSEQQFAVTGLVASSGVKHKRFATAARFAAVLSEYFPTRLHQCLAAAWFTSMFLFVVGTSLGWRMLAAAAGLVLLAAACALSVADVCYLLQAQPGHGQSNGPIQEQEQPARFKLHIVFASTLALSWGVGFFLCLQDVLK